MQQLYMQIKRSSKYYARQQEGKKFYPIEIREDSESYSRSYIVKGGMGGQYEMCDVNIFVQLADGKMQKIGR